MSKLLPRRAERQNAPNVNPPNGPQVTKMTEEYDEPGTEMGKDARVWRVYVQEADQADKEMCDDWDKSLDVILIFAALFSAISTAFILESMKKLQPDPVDTSASTLLDISRTLVAISNGQPVPITSLPDPASVPFIPSLASVLVSALWLTSLVISVGVSLMAMLAKKWCHRFLTNRSGPYYEQARRRQKRWDGIVRWRMQGVMDGLPLLMHLALALFVTGLLVYLWDINRQVAAPVVAITSLFVVLYAAATILPVLFESCPYGTALSDPLKSYILPSIKSIFAGFIFLVVCFSIVICWIPQILLECTGWRSLAKRIESVIVTFGEVNGRLVETLTLESCGNEEDNTKGEDIPMDMITSRILGWLIASSEDRDHVRIAVQAISGASIELPVNHLCESGAVAQISSRLFKCFSTSFYRSNSPDLKPALASSLFRALSCLLTPDGTNNWAFTSWTEDDPVKSQISRKGFVSIYSRLAQYYPYTSEHPEEFVLNASAVMTASLAVGRTSKKNIVAVSCINGAAVELLRVVKSHIKKDIYLSPQMLTPFSAGCSYYLVAKISDGDIDSTVRQLILALLHIYLTPETPSTLKYIIALALASAASAAKQYYSGRNIYENFNGPRPSLYPEDLLRQYIHQGTKESYEYIEASEALFLFGVIGVLTLLPFESLTVQDINAITQSCSPLFAASTLRLPIQLKGLETRLIWRDHIAHTGREWSLLFPNTRASLGVEGAASCLRIFLCTRLQARGLQIDADTISRLCCTRSEEIWQCGLRILGFRVENQQSSYHDTIVSLVHDRLLARLFEASIASNPLTSPQAMRRLWRLVQLVIASANPNSGSHSRLQLLVQLLQHKEFVEIKRSFREHGLPNSIDDMQFGRIWYKTLEPMVSSGPVLNIDNGIIHMMVDHYGKEASAYRSSEEAPVSNDIIELFDKWQKLDNSYRARRAQERWAKLGRIIRIVHHFSHSQNALNIGKNQKSNENRRYI